MPRAGQHPNIFDAHAFGARLRQLREAAGLSGYRLSANMGYVPSYLYGLEHGKQTNITASTILHLCQGLNCTPNDLLLAEAS
jgi:transcriptional regulator with XRE-family HTH domain